MKYKRIFAILMCVAVLVSVFAGCSGKDDSDSKSESQKTESVADAQNVDVDLSKLSTTMFYSELANMMNNPASYVGKTVKIRGQFTLTQNSETNQKYYNVTVTDATACCQQGLEFIWTGHNYPEDYPQVNSTIEVTGVFQTYDENGLTYCHLISDDVKTVAD
ncbi:MAG: hypothetical protein PUE08_03665 [Eubacteriales bacterium]|nr:hypothetical protein [Eubacteriales bacterium]